MVVLNSKLLGEIEIAGRSDAPLLITGETGTGKEVVAKVVYDVRKKGAFVAVNCGAITPTLIEAELFGAQRGAYTGSDRDRTGLIAEADGGTLFLDEVGELPLDMQVKLLRVLQEKTYRQLGSTAIRKSNFRVIAATLQDLQKGIVERRFRDDLYYRLDVLKIHIAPLRDRREDIPALVDYFREQHTYTGQATPQMSGAVFQALFDFQWPGNVRQLGNVIERCMARVSGPLITLADLPEEIAYSQVWTSATSFAKWHEPEPLTLAELEQRAINDALKRCEGNVSEAAKMLGISRATLWRKRREAEGKTDDDEEPSGDQIVIAK